MSFTLLAKVSITLLFMTTMTVRVTGHTFDATTNATIQHLAEAGTVAAVHRLNFDGPNYSAQTVVIHRRFVQLFVNIFTSIVTDIAKPLTFQGNQPSACKSSFGFGTGMFKAQLPSNPSVVVTSDGLEFKITLDLTFAVDDIWARKAWDKLGICIRITCHASGSTSGTIVLTVAVKLWTDSMGLQIQPTATLTSPSKWDTKFGKLTGDWFCDLVSDLVPQIPPLIDKVVSKVVDDAFNSPKIVDGLNSGLTAALQAFTGGLTSGNLVRMCQIHPMPGGSPSSGYLVLVVPYLYKGQWSCGPQGPSRVPEIQTFNCEPQDLYLIQSLKTQNATEAQLASTVSLYYWAGQIFFGKSLIYADIDRSSLQVCAAQGPDPHREDFLGVSFKLINLG